MCCNDEIRRVRGGCSALYQRSVVANGESDKMVQVEGDWM